MKRIPWVLLVLILINSAIVLSCFHVAPSAKAEESNLSRFKVKHRVLFSDTPSAWVFAAVTNEGTDPVTNVSVTITFWDNTGYMINRTVENTELQVILPNRTSPVSASIQDSDAVRYGEHGGWYEVNVTSYDVYPQGRETGLVVNPQSTYLADTGAYVSGTVLNNGSGRVQFIQVFAMFYDEKGFRNFDAAQVIPTSPLPPGGETEVFDINSMFATNASERLACVLTAESPERTNQTAYESDQEVLIWLKGGPDTDGQGFDLRWVVLTAILVVVAASIVALARRRRQKRSHRGKDAMESNKVKAHVLEPTGFYFPNIMNLLRHTYLAYLGLRGLGCKVSGWSVTILGTD